MGNTKAVFTDEDPKQMFQGGEIIVKRVFDFEGEGYAAIVDALPGNDLHLYGGVHTVEPADIQFELLTQPNVQNQRVAEYDEIHSLHKFEDGAPRGDGITIAATDTGVDPDHPIFADRTVNFHDVTGAGRGDDYGHGTAVMGQIAQFAPDANLEMIRIFSGGGATGMEQILAMYEYLFANADRIDVVNMSWGTQSKVEQIDRLQNKLVEKGVRSVTAAGNTGGRGGSPATAKKAFSVGACNVRGQLAEFSSYNPDTNPDVTAVGVNNKLASADGTSMGDRIDEAGQWCAASGTSFASPIVAAAVGRYLEEFAFDETVGIFEKTADNIPDTPEEGEGLLDYNAVIEAARPEYKAESSSKVWSLWKSQKDMMFIDADWLENGKYVARLREEDEDGATIRFEKKSGTSEN